jgi:hypothetical protein
MRLYFSCAITGGRADQPIYAALVAALQAQGHTVLTAALAAASVLTDEGGLTPEAVYDRDIAWVNAADALIAEVSTPSHGVGYEIAWALRRPIPVLGLARAGAPVSKMLSGNHEPGFTFATYASAAEALAQAAAFLAQWGG